MKGTRDEDEEVVTKVFEGGSGVRYRAGESVVGDICGDGGDESEGCGEESFCDSWGDDGEVCLLA